MIDPSTHAVSFEVAQPPSTCAGASVFDPHGDHLEAITHGA